MRMNKLVSIIIPNYNHAAFLQQRLDSVFQQTYQDIEVILLDDASTDGSVEILKKYQDHPKVSHMVINKTNSGSPFKQWQKGIALAQGEYIWIAESDDINELNFLEVCLEQFTVDLMMGMMATGLIQFNHTGETGRIKAFKTGVYMGEEINKDNLSKGNCFYNASSVVFRRLLVGKEALKRLDSYTICGDWWLWVTILKKANLGYTDKLLTQYRKHEGATTADLWNNRLFYLEVRTITFQLFKWHSFKKDKKDKIISYWTSKIQESSLPAAQKLYLKFNFNRLYPAHFLIKKLKNNGIAMFRKKGWV